MHYPPPPTHTRLPTSQRVAFFPDKRRYQRTKHLARHGVHETKSQRSYWHTCTPWTTTATLRGRGLSVRQEGLNVYLGGPWNRPGLNHLEFRRYPAVCAEDVVRLESDGSHALRLHSPTKLWNKTQTRQEENALLQNDRSNALEYGHVLVNDSDTCIGRLSWGDCPINGSATDLARDYNSQDGRTRDEGNYTEVRDQGNSRKGGR